MLFVQNALLFQSTNFGDCGFLKGLEVNVGKITFRVWQQGVVLRFAVANYNQRILAAIKSTPKNKTNSPPNSRRVVVRVSQPFWVGLSPDPRITDESTPAGHRENWSVLDL